MVYFALCTGTGLVKIGVSRCLPDRLRALSTGNPYPIQLLLTLPGGREEEKALHRRFKALHHRGEWYKNEGALQTFLQTYVDFA